MTNETFFTPLRDAVEFESLRYSVGRTIFCPKCLHVLDVHRAVEITFSSGNKVHEVVTVCAACYTSSVSENIPATVEAFKKLGIPNAKAAVIDGREFDEHGHRFETPDGTLGPVGKFTTFHVSEKAEKVTVDGRPVKLRPKWLRPDEPAIDAFVYSYRDGFYCVHTETGAAIASRCTLERVAPAVALQRLDSITREVWEKSLARARKQTR